MVIFDINSIEVGVIISTIISILLVIIGVNEDYKKKSYQKKYLMTVYFLLTVLSIYISNLRLIEIFLYTIIIYFILSLIAAINIAYDIDLMTKRLSRLDLCILKLFEWTFAIRSYMLILYFTSLSFVIFNFRRIGVKSDIIFIVIIYLTYIIAHLLHNAKDTFGTYDFGSTKERFIQGIEEYNSKYKVTTPPSICTEIEIKNNFNIDLMGFILYMEDKDFFTRNRFVIDICIINRRKKEIDNSNLFERFKIEKRGYSTLPQQLIRHLALIEGAYTKSNKRRRKIFVEWVYMPLFFKYYVKERQEYSMNVYGSKKNYEKNMVKVDMLKCYFNIISKCPNNETELFDMMARHSKKLNVSNYKYYYKEYLKSKEKNKYTEIIKQYYYRTYTSI